MVVSCTAPPTWRRVCVVSTFVVMLISWGVGGYDVGAGAGTDVHCRGRNLARLVLRHAPRSGSHPPPMTNFVVGAVLARAALSFWLSAVIFAGDQFGWLLRACCVVRAVVELGRARPQTVSLSSRVRVGGGRRCRWWSPFLPSNLVIPAGCYVPHPVAAHRAWCAAGRRVVGGGGMPFPPGSLRAVVTELSCSR